MVGYVRLFDESLSKCVTLHANIGDSYLQQIRNMGKYGETLKWPCF